MISLGRRDARKELGLGFGGGREMMEDTELEEGEACSYHNNSNNNYDNNNNHDGYDASMDPDIALSYIDEKLQHVLGHFQKDFEGGVSAENLGAKFGGYGSFLPAYQRSPVWSHPRTPSKSQHYSTPRSPSTLQVEGGHHGYGSSSTAPHLVRLEPASTIAPSLPALKAPSLVKQEILMPSSHFAEELAPGYEPANGKSASLTDQKMLRVRIKVGPDNLSTQKNAAIYSGLGLDVSPSTSLEDSPSEGEGMSHEPQDTSFESPVHILQIMTSVPVDGGRLLSPLSDDLLHLTERETLPKDRGSLPIPRIGLQSSGIVVNVADSVQVDGKILVGKKTKSLKRSDGSAESKSENSKDCRNAIDVMPKNEMDLDTLACEELVSNTLKLPLLSNSCSAVLDMATGVDRATNMSKESHKGVVKDKGFSELTKEEPLVPILTQEDGWVENRKSTSARKVRDDKKASSVDSVSACPRKDGHHKGEKHDLVKSDSNVSKVKKAVNAELRDTSKQKADLKAKSIEQEVVKLPPGKECSSSDGKKKIKGSQTDGNVVAESSKESLTVGSSLASKNNKKSSHVEDCTTKVELEDLKLQKNTAKAGDRYREFFGDMELEQEENQKSPSEMCYEDGLKDANGSEKSRHGTNNALKERSSCKKTDKSSESGAHVLVPSNVASRSGHGLVLEAPVLIKENWVCCDKCQQWRLLPLGKNINDLPEKWMCSMLNWLPGMNRCSFTEEETTNALIAWYQVPAPENQSSLQSNATGFMSKVNLAEVQCPDQNHPNSGLHAMPTGGKRNQNTTYKDGPTQMSNSMKKSIQASVTNGNLNDVNRPSMVIEPGFLKLSKSGDLAVEKHKNKQKEKHKVPDNCSDGGDAKRSKTKGKGEPDQDCFRVSKKIKAESLPEDWTSDHGGANEKVGPSSSNGLPAVSSRKNLSKYSSSSKDLKYDQKDRAQVSAKKLKDKVQVSVGERSMDMQKHDGRDVAKKRKVRESQDVQICPGSFVNTRHHTQDGRMSAKEEFSENEYRKEKKARLSRSEGKESSASKGSGRTDKKDNHGKIRQVGQDLGSTVSQRSLDGVDSLRRDFGSSVAAASSSSKVSGSHKTKANFHDAKGSPVESVSSSPLRVSKPEKLTSTRRNLTEKDDSADGGFLTIGGPRRCSDGEDEGGSDHCGTATKEKNLDVAHHGSLESSVVDFQERDSLVSGGKAKAQIMLSPDITNRHFTNSGVDYLGQESQHPSKLTTLDQCQHGGRQNENHYYSTGSRPKKSGKGSASWSKDKNRNVNSEYGNSIVKVSDSISERAPSYEVQQTDGKNKIEDEFGIKSDENENRYVDKKHSAGLLLSENGKKETQLDFGGHSGPDVTVDTICSHDVPSTAKHGVPLLCETVTGRGKSPLLPPSAGAQNETLAHCSQPVSGSEKGNGANSLSVNASGGDNAPKAVKQIRKVDLPNGMHHNSSRNSTSNGHRARDLDAASPVKRDSSSQAASNAVKEAKNLKHMADRLKNSGSNLESTKLYFEAALKFLHGASLLETCSIENAKNGDMIQSMQMYSSTAKLCEFCAHEYEKSKDMAAAALAYKCMEVAYMRVIYSSHTNANKDRHELHNALQAPGESPSSSASDIDNLNHPTTMDKVSLAKGVGSPQVTGSHIISVRNRPNLMRLLSFAQDVNFAMEASRKSRIAFAAANVSLGEAQCSEGISSIKTALDFNFQDVEGLLRLVRLAIEAINR